MGSLLSQAEKDGNYLPRKTFMKSSDFTFNPSVSQTHFKTPTVVVVEKEILDPSSPCSTVAPLVTILQFTPQEFKSCFLLNQLNPDLYSQVSK